MGRIQSTPHFMEGSKRIIRGRWIHLFLISFSLNLALLCYYPLSHSPSHHQQHQHFLHRRLDHQQDEFVVPDLGIDLELCTYDHEEEMEKLSVEDRICSGRIRENGSDKLPNDTVINLDHGDPTMFELFWRKVGEECSITLSGWQKMSYFSDVRNFCWFLEPEFADAVRKLHQLVGNVKVDDHYIVVGTGSTQLFQAALYALSPPDASEPMNVVSAVPFYSSFQSVTDFLKSGLYRWAGDALAYSSDAPYIELVTSPNNPDGHMNKAVVNRTGGRLIHDLAYYWPQYTPITASADHDLMLFTVSKSTGHAGTRIGWALVKDPNTARRMTKFIELNTIGVSKDSQLRAAKILQAVHDGYIGAGVGENEKFFDFGRHLMTERWNRLRDTVQKGSVFSLPEYPEGYCSFAKETCTSHPAFAWLKCEKEAECEGFLKKHNILVRSGKHFGADTRYVRVSMLDRNEVFDLFIQRLSEMQ